MIFLHVDKTNLCEFNQKAEKSCYNQTSPIAIIAIGDVFILLSLFVSLFGRHFLGVLVTGADSALGDNLACLGEGDLGEEGTYDFVYQNGEKGDVQHQLAAGDAGCGRRCLGCHAQRNACLRKQGNTQILDDVRLAFGHLGTAECAQIFACGTGEDVDHANEDDDPALEYAQVQFCAAEDEEENEERSGPAIDTVHEFFGEITDVAEDCAQHHAGKERREGDVNAAYGEGHGGDTNGDQHEPYRNRKTLGAGMEETLHEVENEAHECAQCDGKNNLDDRLQHYG